MEVILSKQTICSDCQKIKSSQLKYKHICTKITCSGCMSEHGIKCNKCKLEKQNLSTTVPKSKSHLLQREAGGGGVA